MAPNPTNHPIRWKERIGIIATGHIVKRIESFFFDEVLYGVVTLYFLSIFGWSGALQTFMVMASVSAVECLALIKLYDWAKLDLFGFETVKELRDGLEEGGRWKRLLHRVVRLGDIPAFFVFSLWYPGADPFLATVYLRRGKYNGMTRRDWDIFFAAVIVANGWWTLRWTLLAKFCGFLWELAKTVFSYWRLGF